MSENKFIAKLKGKAAAASVVEVRKEDTKKTFDNAPGSGARFSAFDDVRDDAAIVASGAQNWKIVEAELVPAERLTGDARDLTNIRQVSGNGQWIKAAYEFPGEPGRLPAYKIMKHSKWVLNLCGLNMLANVEYIPFTFLVMAGAKQVAVKQCYAKRQAGEFSRQFILDFSETDVEDISIEAGESLTVQLLCNEETANMVIYDGMTTLTLLERRVDASAVGTKNITFDDLEKRITKNEQDIGDIDSLDPNDDGTRATNLVEAVNGLRMDSHTGDELLRADLESAEDRITTIEGKIPGAASPTNQLADKAFVNSTIQTATANFRGNYPNWASVPTNVDDYPVDYAGSKVPTVNDYMAVADASAYPGQMLVGTWRFKYSGKWDVDGKNGWLPEYQINEEPFTMAQLAAINSGITSEKVAQYDGYATGKVNMAQGAENANKVLVVGPAGTVVLRNPTCISDYGIKGDYMSRYGIVDMQVGMISKAGSTNNLVIPAGIVLKVPGSPTLVTIASSQTHTTTSTGPFTLFYAKDPTTGATQFVEATSVHYTDSEPGDNGVNGFQFWWSPMHGLWQARSVDTGNQWRDLIATPLCDCLFTGSSLTRIEFVGYRVLNNQMFSTQGLVPTGTVISFAGNSAPSGYLICDGAAVSRTLYASLFAVIGTIYGAGDGNSTFNLPDYIYRHPIGATPGEKGDGSLPAITGGFNSCIFVPPYNTPAAAMTGWGCMSGQYPIDAYGHIKTSQGQNMRYYNINFNAINSSNVYHRNDNQVIARYLGSRFCIKY